MKRDCFPLEIHLPDGTRAEYVAGSRPPRYMVDNDERAIDVTIPADLVDSGWHWSGSFLAQPQPPGTESGPGIAILTSRYGPPGWTYTTSGRIRVPGYWPSIYVTARYFDVRWREYLAEQAAPRAVKSPKKPKAVKQAPAVPEPIVEQMELAL